MITRRSRAFGWLVAVVALAAFGAAVAACGGGGNNGNATEEPTATVEATPQPTSEGTATATTVAETTVTPEFTGNREPVSGGDENVTAPLLTDVRAAGHDGFDRIVFQFDGDMPSYTVQYVTPPINACGSGEAVDIAGNALLQVRFYPTNAHTEAGDLTVPLELSPNLPSLIEAKSACDFEAVVIWGMGLTQESDFAVTELGNPTRLVIDIATP